MGRRTIAPMIDAGVRYTINERDELTSVGGAWDRFAIANGGSQLVGDGVIGRVLWKFISDEHTRYLYRQIVARVRLGQLARFTLRCDAPSSRRLLEMVVEQHATGEVEFATQSLHVDAREPSPLFSPESPHSDELVRACSWCNRIEVDAEHWAELEVAVAALKLFEQVKMPMLSHGICGACFEIMARNLGDMGAKA